MKTYSIVAFYLVAFSLLFLNPISGFTKTVYVNSSANLQSALTAAQAGDEIIVANGTYTGKFSITKNSGTASNPIILRAEQPHKAVLKGSGNFSDATNVGLTVSRAYWIIEGLEIKDYLLGMLIQNSSAHHVEVRHNLIHNFGARGIDINASSNNSVHHNVVAFSPAVEGWSSYAGVSIGNNGQHNAVEHNIIYSMTNDGHQCGDAGGCGVGAKRGYGLTVAKSSNNMVRGNLIMDSAKGTLRVFSVPGDAYPTNYNQIKDNIFAFSEGGGVGVSDDVSSYNTVVNNFIYDVYYSGWTAKGNTPGFNIFQHNTTVVTAFSRVGNMLNRADDGGSSSATTVKDNLFYSSNANGGSQYLWRVDDWSKAIKESHHNLFWRPGSSSVWTSGVTFHSTDIRQQPQFVDSQNGDFSLAPNSPGKAAASDGKDIGIEFNEYLKKQWARNISALPSQEKATTGKSLSFSASSANQYQVYVYIPDSTAYRGIETFSIEGNPIQRDYKNIIAGGWVGAAPQRWIYLGTHANNGTLDVSWTQTNTVGKIFIRQLPTPSEAYSWISGTEMQKPLPAPTALKLVAAGN